MGTTPVLVKSKFSRGGVEGAEMDLNQILVNDLESKLSNDLEFE